MDLASMRLPWVVVEQVVNLHHGTEVKVPTVCFQASLLQEEEVEVLTDLVEILQEKHGMKEGQVAEQGKILEVHIRVGQEFHLHKGTMVVIPFIISVHPPTYVMEEVEEQGRWGQMQLLA